MESIVVYVQENNTSYRLKRPSQEICRLCLELTSLQPIKDSLHAKDFNNFSFIGVTLDYDMPEKICKTCLTKLDEIGELLKKWQGSLYTYKKMEDNCARVKQIKNPTKNINVLKSDEICETIKIVTKPEEAEEEEPCEVIEIVTKPEVTDESLNIADESEEMIQSEIDLTDETEATKTDLSEENDEILRIETELPLESSQNSISEEKSTPSTPVTIKPVSPKVRLRRLPQRPPKSAPSSKGDSGKKICHKCGTCVTSLTQHYKTSYQCQARNFKCPMCNVYVNNTVKLLDHQRAYHWDQISATRLTCHICGQTFKYGCSLKRHLQVHEKGKQFMCEICGKGYTRATDLRDHTNIHLKVKPYVCETCGKAFTSKANLCSHIAKHSPTTTGKLYAARKQTKPRKTVDLDVACSICDRHFTRSDFLEKHMTSHGENTRPRECKKCNIQFDTLKQHREHAEMHKKKEHTCSYCSKTFHSAVVLEQHKFTHTGERPFLCSLCGSKFRAATHLKRHDMLIHNINRGKPFKCKYCEKTFALKENLLPHERIHTGEKPYKCHVCDKKFIDPSSRKKHVRRCHGEEECKNIQPGVSK